MTALKDMGIKNISRNIARYLSEAPNGEIGVVDVMDLPELRTALKNRGRMVALCTSEGPALSSIFCRELEMPNSVALEREELRSRVMQEIYVVDSSMGHLNSWVAAQLFRMSHAAKVIVILNDLDEGKEND